MNIDTLHLPFVTWLRGQTDDDGAIGQLAAGARADRSMASHGDVEVVRSRLRATMADGDMFEALDDAESLWLKT